MATMNVLLDTRRPKANNRFPLKVRITHVKKSVHHSFGIDLSIKEWDSNKERVRTNHPNYKKLNLKISGISNKIQEIILDLEKTGKPYSASKIKSVFEGEKQFDTVVNYWKQHIIQLREAKRFGTARTFQDSLKKLLQYTGGKDCQFEELDYSMLTKFEIYMLKDNLKVNSISVYLRSLKALYNKAIKEGIVQRIHYPFYDFHIKSESTPSRSMSIEDLRRLVLYPYQYGSTKWRFRQFFLFSFAFIGMSFIDMSFLKKSNIIKGRLIYRRRKTGRLYSIGLNEYNSEILKSLAPQSTLSDDYLLPILKLDEPDDEKLLKTSRDVYSRCNKYLKLIAEEVGIDPAISTYWARYSWANTARKQGFSKDMIAEALGHSYGNRVTSIYLDEYDSHEIDQMNKSVLSRIFLDL